MDNANVDCCFNFYSSFMKFQSIDTVIDRSRGIGQLYHITSVYRIWPETAERNFGILTMLKIVDFTGPTFIWPSKKTEVPFCSFSPKVNFWGYTKINNVHNYNSNPANVELLTPKIHQNRPFSRSPKCRNQNHLSPKRYHRNGSLVLKYLVVKYPVQKISLYVPVSLAIF